jgi:hypothetical protein
MQVTRSVEILTEFGKQHSPGVTKEERIVDMGQVVYVESK